MSRRPVVGEECILNTDLPLSDGDTLTKGAIGTLLECDALLGRVAFGSAQIFVDMERLDVFTSDMRLAQTRFAQPFGVSLNEVLYAVRTVVNAGPGELEGARSELIAIWERIPETVKARLP